MARIYVYGSCVSRDSFDFLDKSRHQLLGYTARQSLISATGKPYPIAAQTGRLESRFQIRNLQGDFDGSIFRTLLDVGAQAEYVFWDLTDERLGVMKLSDGAYITRSVELLQSGLLEGQDDAEWIKFGSEEHFVLWEESVKRFAEFTQAHAIESKIVLFNLPWSMWDDDGVPLNKTWDMFPDEANNLFARYVAVIRKHMNVRCLELPWDRTVSSKTHKWSLAPYHYQDQVYGLIAEQFTALESGDSTANPDSSIDLGFTENAEWHDSVTHPLTRIMPPGLQAFGLQLEARSTSTPVRLIISLKLEGAEGLHLYKQRITKSVLPDIGHFRYLDVDSGVRSYFAGFELPEGVSCSSITVKGWQVGKGQIQLGRMSVLSRPGVRDDGLE